MNIFFKIAKEFSRLIKITNQILKNRKMYCLLSEFCRNFTNIFQVNNIPNPILSCSTNCSTIRYRSNCAAAFFQGTTPVRIKLDSNTDCNPPCRAGTPRFVVWFQKSRTLHERCASPPGAPTRCWCWALFGGEWKIREKREVRKIKSVTVRS